MAAHRSERQWLHRHPDQERIVPKYRLSPAVPGHRRTRFVTFEEVDYIRADGNYAVLVGAGHVV